MQEIHGKNNTKEYTVDMRRVLQVLWKRAWIIILVAILVGVGVFVGAKLFVMPRYSSSFTAYVNNRHSTLEGQGSTSSSDISASRNLTYLYEEIIVSRSVLTDAALNCNLNYSYNQLRSMVKTSVSSNAPIITVSVEARDPQQAQQLAEAIAAASPRHVERIVDGSSMRIVDSPVLPMEPFAPNSVRSGMLGAAVALILTIAIVILFDMIVDKVDAPKELEDRHGLAVVGVIPDMVQADKYEHSTASSARRK